jgi:hypothetical protein
MKALFNKVVVKIMVYVMLLAMLSSVVLFTANMFLS